MRGRGSQAVLRLTAAAFCIVLNMAGAYLALLFRLPVYLDSLGTVLAGALMGPWYGLAAQQGEPWAQTNLGSCYPQGQGVGQNNTQAIYWYRKAADQGHKEAQERLAALSAAEESGGEGE